MKLRNFGFSSAVFAIATQMLGCAPLPIGGGSAGERGVFGGLSFDPLPIAMPRSPRRFVIRGDEWVLFEFQEAQLRPGAAAFLDQVAALLLARPGAHAVIEGHTDNLGGRPLNMELSELRALVVMKALVDRGVPRSRLDAFGYGFDRPIADNRTEQGRRLNRRTEIVIEDRVGNVVPARSALIQTAPD